MLSLHWKGSALSLKLCSSTVGLRIQRGSNGLPRHCSAGLRRMLPALFSWARLLWEGGGFFSCGGHSLTGEPFERVTWTHSKKLSLSRQLRSHAISRWLMDIHTPTTGHVISCTQVGLRLPANSKCSLPQKKTQNTRSNRQPHSMNIYRIFHDSKPKVPK